ncbi:hypothetical protein HRI_002151400 [Hibiscus trionum]|uniref:Reverse transcriptase n=1 Tax=Hibiscus trionum TaxID=183268 RepID=A0A9W7HXE7_HIBTR|nr:hypothetical protein HRI_002151400 [Hibiscus trionum]
MVNHSESIKLLQDTSTLHAQSLASLQSHADDQKQWNERTDKTLQEMAKQLLAISGQLGISAGSSGAGEISSASTVQRGKMKLRSDTEDAFLFAPKPVQVELPLFSGADPEEWIAAAQDFFEFYGTEDHHRVTMASFRMDGIARKWFRWMQRQRQLVGWSHLVEAIRKRFAIMEVESPEGQLSKLTQSTTVQDYLNRFEELALRTTNLSDEFLTQCFISGLRSDIKNEVLSHRSSSMVEVAALARFQEARFHEKRLANRAPGTRLPPLLSTPPVIPPDAKLQPGRPPPMDAAGGLPSLQPRRISAAEAQARRAKGLCYYCDAKYVPGHKCRDPQLFCLDDDWVEECPTVQVEPQGSSADDGSGKEHSLVSFNALAGCYYPNTIRVVGEIMGKPVRILIDGGSTHNFVQSRVAKFLGLPISAAPHFRVMVGNGAKLPNEGCVRDLQLSVQGTAIKTDFYVLPLEGTEMVLGVAWMATLGPITMDFSTRQFQFRQGSQVHCWIGESPDSIQQVQLHSLRRLSSTHAMAECFYLHLQVDSAVEDEYVSQDLSAVLEEYADVFAPPQDLPPPRDNDYAIHLQPLASPVNVRPYRYPYFQKAEVERQVQLMLDQGLIRHSTSSFSSPVLLVKKKDGSWRFCVDYRALNAVTIKDKFPIPTAEELFDELGSSRFFSKLDLLAGYHQIRVRDSDVHKTAFRTHDGHYEFLVMPFGLTNAPSTFQATMNSIFRQYLRKFVLVFIDDILVYSRSWEDHLLHVRMVLQCLQAHGFVAKRSKCSFGRSSVEYLGHIVSGDGLAVDPAKVQAIREWAAPTTLKEVRSFLGLASYYRKFIKGFATLASPISDLLRKGASFQWTAAAQSAMNQLKDRLCSAPILAFPDFDMVFHVETDASGVGVGAVLSQGGRLLAFFSQKLCPRMQQASTYSREMFAITQAIAKWRQYLVGHRFVIITDQRSLRELNQQTIQTPEQQRWLSKLVGYDFDIQYRPGKLNDVPDALSREPAATCMAMSRPLLGIVDAIRAATVTDSELHRLYTAVNEGTSTYTGYSCQDGLLLWHGRIVVPRETALRKLLLREFHASVLGGHAGISRTFHRLAASFYWAGLRSDVRSFVTECQVCHRMKSSSLAPAGLLQPLPIPTQVFEDISMDFVIGLPKSAEKETVFVVVDRLTKYGHFFGLPRQIDSSLVARVLVQGVIKLHGMPCTIVCDRDRVFMSSLWTELARLQGIELCFSSAYHPQSDGQTEALNKVLEMYLRCMAGDDPRKWHSYLPWAEYWYNTALQTSAGMTPFRALYGRDPPTILSYVEGSSRHDQLASALLDRDAVLKELKRNLENAQNRMKTQADRHRRELSLDVGSWVFVRLQPYRQLSLRLQRQHKLSPRYFGPYRIVQRVGQVAYKLDLPDSTRIHSVFHVSQLKPCKGAPLQQITPLPLLREDVLPLNLEDKVVSPGEGDVVIQQPMQPCSVPTRAEPSNSEATIGPAEVVTRRSNRERKLPSKFSDFVLSD